MKVCVEAGATPLLRNFRVGCAALVAPASGLVHAGRRPTADRIRYLKEVPARTGVGPKSVPDFDWSKYLVLSTRVPGQDRNRYRG